MEGVGVGSVVRECGEWWTLKWVGWCWGWGGVVDERGFG